MKLQKLQRLVFVLALYLILASPASTAAHGGGILQLSGAPAGPYHLTIWTSPATAHVDRPFHVTVAVASAEDNSPVLDATVLLQVFTPDSQTPVLAAEATTAQSTNRLFYEADIVLADAGPYRIDLAVTGPGGGGGNVTFNVEARPGSPINWLGLGLIGLSLIIGVDAFILWRKRQRPAAKRSPLQPRRHKPGQEARLSSDK